MKNYGENNKKFRGTSGRKEAKEKRKKRKREKRDENVYKASDSHTSASMNEK